MSNYTKELKGKELKEYLAQRKEELDYLKGRRANREFPFGHTQEADTDLINHISDNIGNYEGQYFDDLHHYLFNEDYYIIGYYQAEQFIKENNLNPFDLIRYCQEQEIENFGEINNTFDNSEKLVNHYAYWRGQELMYNIKAIQDFRGQRVTEELIKEVEEELK